MMPSCCNCNKRCKGFDSYCSKKCEKEFNERPDIRAINEWDKRHPNPTWKEFDDPKDPRPERKYP
jgi:hypothetical protein